MSITGYTPGIELGAGLTPSGNGSFPLMQACDILAEKDKRLDAVIEELRAGAGAVDVNAVVDLVLSRLPGDSPLPHEVLTETEMTAILSNATSASIGAVYKYMGPTTDTYTHGELYIIQEE